MATLMKVRRQIRALERVKAVEPLIRSKDGKKITINADKVEAYKQAQTKLAEIFRHHNRERLQERLHRVI